jgi:homoserine kinase
MIKRNKITVTAPASVSNVGPGFDILGFPLDVISDTIELSINKDNSEIRITEILPSELGISKELNKNTAGKALLNMMKEIDSDFGINLRIIKELGIGTGLGSSAASAVGSVFALNEILDKPFDKNDLIKFALQGEEVASGSIHGDNVIPCMVGGFVLVRSAELIDYSKINYPKDLICLVIKPDVIIETKKAREVIPTNYPRNILIEQSVNIASLTIGLMNGDYDLIKKSIIDNVAEPYRKSLIPFYDEIKELVTAYNSYGFSISGSGPALFAFFNDQNKAHASGLASVEFYHKNNIKADYFVSAINSIGPKVIA